MIINKQSNFKHGIDNLYFREGKHVRLVAPAIPPELVMEEERARIFSSRGHWELSTAVTTTHLLAIIALANTLMSMNSATFVPEQERRRKLHRLLLVDIVFIICFNFIKFYIMSEI